MASASRSRCSAAGKSVTGSPPRRLELRHEVRIGARTRDYPRGSGQRWSSRWRSRPVVAFGSFDVVKGDGAQIAAFRAFTDKLVSGRRSEVRAPSAKELRAAAILALDLAEASVKVRSGPPDDDNSPDAARDTWAGVVPLTLSHGEPQPSAGLRAELALAPCVERLLAEARR
jgi:Pyridoxamine 5'-phosphate oxidase